MLVKCVYCDVDNDALSTGGFCESCGKKLPSSAMVKPRRTLGGDAPEEPGERSPLPHKSKAVSEGLFAAGLIYLFAGGAFLILASPVYTWLHEVPAHFGPSVLSWTLLPALLVALLGVLARWAPMPALVMALTFALLWVPLTFFLHRPLAVGWLSIDLVLFAMLGWALWRGVRLEKRPGG
jgi:hypothetical protein